MWIAARYRQAAVVKVLVQRADVNVNSISVHGRAPLFWPSYLGYEQVVALMIEAGADLGPVDENGDTAVIVARRNGHGRVVKMLEWSRTG